MLYYRSPNDKFGKMIQSRFILPTTIICLTTKEPYEWMINFHHHYLTKCLIIKIMSFYNFNVLTSSGIRFQLHLFMLTIYRKSTQKLRVLKYLSSFYNIMILIDDNPFLEFISLHLIHLFNNRNSFSLTRQGNSAQ